MARSKTWHEWGAVTTAKEPFDAATMKIIADTAREQVAAQEERKYMADMSGEFAKPNEAEIITEELPISKWQALAETFNAAINDLSADESRATLQPVMTLQAGHQHMSILFEPKGYRKRVFYKGTVFQIDGVRSTKLNKSTNGLILVMTPVLETCSPEIANELREQNMQHVELTLNEARKAFGSALDTHWLNIMGQTIDDSIATVSGKLRPKAPSKAAPPAPPKREVEKLNDWGDW